MKLHADAGSAPILYNGLGVGPSQIHTSQGIGPKTGLFFDLKRMFLGLKMGF
jgi:hypothetical protein